jgi:hypothetical protein
MNKRQKIPSFPKRFCRENGFIVSSLRPSISSSNLKNFKPIRILYGYPTEAFGYDEQPTNRDEPLLMTESP